MLKRDVRTAGRILQALFAGEDSEDATAGGLLMGAAIIALVNPPTKGGK